VGGVTPAVWVAGLLAFSSPAPVQDARPALEEVVPRLSTPSRQLDHARRLKNARRGRSPEERERWSRKAVAAYRAVRVHYPWATRLGSEAAFRAGELLSAGGDPEEALAEFEVALALGAGTPFRARSRLAIGRLRRRAGDLGKSLEAFQGVIADPESSAQHRDEAWLWVGRVRRDMGRDEDARRAWSRVAEHARDPLDRIAAYDFLGTSWMDAGDLEAAAGVLDQCLRALAEVALERTNTGERVRSALGRTRLVRCLPERIKARLRSSPSKGSPRKD